MHARRSAVLAEQRVRLLFESQPWFGGSQVLSLGNETYAVQVLANVAASLEQQGVLQPGDLDAYVAPEMPEVPARVNNVPVHVVVQPTPEVPQSPASPEPEERREVRPTRVLTTADTARPRHDRPTEVEEGSRSRHRKLAMKYERVAARARSSGYLIAAEEAVRRAAYHRRRVKEG